MKSKSSTALAAALLALCGCVTPYQPQGFMGGFQESRLAPDTVNINVAGNAYTGKATTGDYALVRAAELALQDNYSHFTILNSGNESRASGAFSQRSGWSAITSYQYKPESGLSVRFFRAPNIPDGAIPASYLLRQMIVKYPGIAPKLQVALGELALAEQEAAVRPASFSSSGQHSSAAVLSSNASSGCLEQQATSRGIDAQRFSVWLDRLPAPERDSRQQSCAAGNKESVLRTFSYFLGG